MAVAAIAAKGPSRRGVELVVAMTTNRSPTEDELHDSILHSLRFVLGGFGSRNQIYNRAVEPEQIHGSSQKRKAKYRFNRVLADLERHGLLENSNGFLIAKEKLEAAAANRISRPGAAYARSPAIRAAVMKRAKGKCEFCGEPGFMGIDGAPYLECHHIVALANDGVDRMINVIAICANHHREAHFGKQHDEIEKRMIRIVEKAEQFRLGRCGPLSAHPISPV
jgi:hypothetical protein